MNRRSLLEGVRNALESEMVEQVEDESLVVRLAVDHADTQGYPLEVVVPMPASHEQAKGSDGDPVADGWHPIAVLVLDHVEVAVGHVQPDAHARASHDRANVRRQ